MDKKILYNIITKNPDSLSREYLMKYVENTEFVASECGNFAIDENNPRIRFVIKPINKPPNK